MIKIVSAIAVFLAVCCGIFIFRYNYAQNQISALQTQINAVKGNNVFLQEEISRRNRNAVELGNKIKELEEAVKNDTSGFNWNVDISDSLVVRRLQGRD